MKIVVLSDSHGSADTVLKIIQSENPFDEMIFCGDGIEDLADGRIPKSFLINAVTGNVDRAKGLTGDLFLNLEIGGIRFYVSHGDRSNVKVTYEYIRKAGKEKASDITVFGHTHCQYLSGGENPVLLNPGPAEKGYYAVISIGEKTAITLKRVK